jgi:hypothetical protein
MNCKNCHLPIINTVNHIHFKNKYVKLFRKLFPKKPIDLHYCTQCYDFMANELEIEDNSQMEHLNSYKEPPKKNTEQTSRSSPSLDEKKIVKRYEILDESSSEYINIKEHFNATVSFKIIRIEKNNNPSLEQKFNERSKQLTCQNIQYLFHGSHDKAYDNILETGFDLDYSAPTGLLGKGIYFAEDASYSHLYGRLTRTNIGKINHLLYCKVNLGQTCKGQTGLIQTPPGFDGVHSDHKTYAVFDNYQGMPEYIIYYLVENDNDKIDII